MEKYKIVFKKSAERELYKIQGKELHKIVQRVQGLKNNSKPSGAKKLTNHEHYRIRQGNYRIIYAIDESKSIITIFKIGHRKEVYRL